MLVLIKIKETKVMRDPGLTIIWYVLGILGMFVLYRKGLLLYFFDFGGCLVFLISIAAMIGFGGITLAIALLL